MQTSGPQKYHTVQVGSHRTDGCSATAARQGPQEKDPQKMLFSAGFLNEALAQGPLERRLGEEA